MLPLPLFVSPRHLCVAVVLSFAAVWESAHAVAAALDDRKTVEATIAAAKLDANATQVGDSEPKKKKKKAKGATDGTTESKRKARHPGFSVGKTLNVELTGRIEGGVRNASSAVGLDGARAEWQDRRLGVKGTAFKRINFEVARELGEDFETSAGLSEKTAWRDVYASVRLAKPLSVQAGHFKLPFGYEELTGETDLDFINRSLAARVLSPGRDTGIMVDGRIGGRRFEYRAGYFTRDGENARTSQTEGGRGTFATHVAFSSNTPKDAPFTFEIGGSASRSQIDGNLGLRGRTVLGDGIFFDRSFVNGTRQRIGLESAVAAGPVSVSAEYIRDDDERLGMGFDGEDLPSIRASAWYLAGTWALTGERKHGRLDPRHDFLNGGIGALELAARYERLLFNDSTYPGEQYGFPATSKLAGNSDRALTVGLNWYLNEYVKLQGNVIVETIADPSRSPAPSTNGRFTSTLFRVQIRL
jgi:phosphate-selective porin OprO/OprP